VDGHVLRHIKLQPPDVVVERDRVRVDVQGIVTVQERTGVDAVLNAAALTYVAAAVSTLLTLLYFLWRSGLIGKRR
jgi:Zn-dependent membrane protease YugP